MYFWQVTVVVGAFLVIFLGVLILKPKKNIENEPQPVFREGFRNIFDLKGITTLGSHCHIPAFEKVYGSPSDYFEEILEALVYLKTQIDKDITLCFVETGEEEGLDVIVAIWVKIEP